MEKFTIAEMLGELIGGFLAKESSGERESTRPETLDGETNARKDGKHSEVGTKSDDTYQEE